MNKGVYLLGVVAVLIFILVNSLIIVDEREKVLVLRFSAVVDTHEEPGLKFKVPFIDTTVSYDDRIRGLDMPVIQVTPLDDRRLDVDAFARYRIIDVRAVREAVGTGGEARIDELLADILNDELRAVLGSVSSNDILSTDRAALMLRIRSSAEDRASALGITVIEVRLKRTDLPDANLLATFGRMEAERGREAQDERARGQEAAERIRALADRTAVERVSEAQREAEIIRGEADARRNAIFAEAFGADPEFFEFYRALAAYRTALRADNSTLVLSPENDFFDYLRTDQPNPDRVQPAAIPVEEDAVEEEVVPVPAGGDDPGDN